MIVTNLLEKLNESMFESVDLDEILDLRDSDPFDGEWNCVYKAIEEQKKIKGYSDENKHLTDEYRRSAYLRVYNLCSNDDLAAYISDSELISYTDSWLEALTKIYANSKIPCGEI